MAKVEISVDTEKKTVDVKVGGKKIGNVSSIYVSSHEDYFSIEMSQFEELEDMKKITRLMASADDKEWKEQEEPIDHEALAEVLLRRKVK